MPKSFDSTPRGGCILPLKAFNCSSYTREEALA
jgi:hypothetical protein